MVYRDMKNKHLLENNHNASKYLRFKYDIIMVMEITISDKLIMHCIEREIISKYILSSKIR